MNRKSLFALAASVGAFALLRAVTRTPRQNLHGRVAIVTGGGRGLGLAITRALLEQGCHVAICGRNGAVIEQAVEALRTQRTSDADVWGMACDASDPAQVEAFFQQVVRRYGTLDVLVNNAGQCFVGPAAELTREDVERALRNIFWVQYHPTMAALPHLRERGTGHIVNITSIGGKVPVPHQAAYVAGKFAATGWSETLALELRREGIEVSTITPPPLRNGAPLHAHFNGRREEEFTWFARTLTSPWSATSPERVAQSVVDVLRRGGGERAVGGGAWLLARMHGMAPRATSMWLSWVNRYLPQSAGPGEHSSMLRGAEVARASSDEAVGRLANRARRDERHYRASGAELQGRAHTNAGGHLPT